MLAWFLLFSLVGGVILGLGLHIGDRLWEKYKERNKK